MKRIMLIAFALSAFGATAMPTKEEQAKAQSIVNELMKDHISANKKGKESNEAVGDAAMALAKDAEGEAVKFALFKGAVTYYARGKEYDKAADALEAIISEIGDVPPQTLNGILSKVAADVPEKKAPRLVALKKSIGRRVKAEASLKELNAKLKKTPGDATLKRMHAELVAATGDWEAALEEFAALDGEPARIARLENPDVKPAADPTCYNVRRTAGQTRQIETQLNSIVIPNVEFKPPQTILDAVEYFRNASYEHGDKKLPKDKRGIKFLFKLHEQPEIQPMVVVEDNFDEPGSDEAEPDPGLAGIPQIPAMTASQIKLRDLIKRVCEPVGYRFVVRNDHVIILPKDMSLPEDAGRSDGRHNWRESLDIAVFWHGYKCAAGVAAEAVRSHAIEHYRSAQKETKYSCFNLSYVGDLIEKCIKDLEGGASQETKGAKQYDTLKTQLMLVKLMGSIRLDTISFNSSSTVADAVEYFNKASREHDPRKDLPDEKKGVKFVLKADAGKKAKMVAASDIDLATAAGLVFEECFGCKIVFEGENVVIK